MQGLPNGNTDVLQHEQRERHVAARRSRLQEGSGASRYYLIGRPPLLQSAEHRLEGADGDARCSSHGRCEADSSSKMPTGDHHPKSASPEPIWNLSAGCSRKRLYKLLISILLSFQDLVEPRGIEPLTFALRSEGLRLHFPPNHVITTETQESTLTFTAYNRHGCDGRRLLVGS